MMKECATEGKKDADRKDCEKITQTFRDGSNMYMTTKAAGMFVDGMIMVAPKAPSCLKLGWQLIEKTVLPNKRPQFCLKVAEEWQKECEGRLGLNFNEWK
jgi:hypothetical protein